MRLKCRWKNAGHPSVFKVATGEAVHTMGFAYVNGRFLGMNHHPESADIRRCIEICGGNIKRGLMFFVESMMRKSASDILRGPPPGCGADRLARTFALTRNQVAEPRNARIDISLYHQRTYNFQTIQIKMLDRIEDTITIHAHPLNPQGVSKCCSVLSSLAIRHL